MGTTIATVKQLGASAVAVPQCIANQFMPRHVFAGLDEIYLAEIPAPGLTLPPGATAEGIDEMRLVTTGDFAQLIAEGEVVDPYVLAAYAFATAKGLLKP